MAYKIGDEFTGRRSGKRYAITSQNKNGDWIMSRDDGTTHVYTSASITRIMVPVAPTAQVANSPYAIGNEFIGLSSGERYKIIRQAPNAHWELSCSNGLTYNMDDAYITRTLTPVVSLLSVLAVATPPSKYKVGDAFIVNATKKRYVITKQIGVDTWELERDDGTITNWDEYSIGVAMTPEVATPTPVVTTTTTPPAKTPPKEEPPKNCCRIGFAQHLAGLRCPTHDKKPKPANNFEYLISEWELLPDAEPKKWWRR